MRSKSKSNLFALACLVGTVWASVATSDGLGGFYGTYAVKSDRVNPTFDQTVTVVDSKITSPGAVTYQTLGFPNNELRLKFANSGTVGGKQRVCENTLEEGDIDDSFLYTCSDNGQFVCNIYFSSN